MMETRAPPPTPVPAAHASVQAQPAATTATHAQTTDVILCWDVPTPTTPRTVAMGMSAPLATPAPAGPVSVAQRRSRATTGTLAPTTCVILPWAASTQPTRPRAKTAIPAQVATRARMVCVSRVARRTATTETPAPMMAAIQQQVAPIVRTPPAVMTEASVP